jgi:hypothetical protein
VIAGRPRGSSSPASAAGRVSGRYQQMELEYGPLPATDLARRSRSTPAKATARYEEGLLTIVLPIAAKQPKRAARLDHDRRDR